jgi:streptomycin 6-kinase
MERWDLQECRTIFENKRKAVYEAVSLKYGPVILKINRDVKQLGEEVLLLQALDGDGCCRLYDYDRESGFLLEERIMPGKLLREVADLDKRINAFAHVFRHIHIYHPEEGQAPDYRQWLDGICEFCVQKNVNREITRKVYEARAICGEMFEKYPERVLLHGDLHHDNLLLREDGTYGIIDPKSVVGPEILDVARFLKNEIDTQYDIPVKEHMYRAALAISEALDYPLEDVIKVYFMEVILGNVWCLEDGDAMSEEEIAVAYELYQNDCH